MPEPTKPTSGGRKPDSAPPSDAGGEAPDKTEWLDIIFDLVFAVGITELSDTFADGLSLRGLLIFLFLLVPFWWVWMGYTVFNARFDLDDTPHRLLSFAMMLAVSIMCVQVLHDLHGIQIFAGAYIASRVILLAMYARVYKRFRKLQPVIRAYLQGFGVGVGFWTISIFVTPPEKYVFWAIGLLIDLIFPWIIRCLLEKATIDAMRIRQRLMEFMSIVLGVGIQNVIVGTADIHWQSKAVFVALEAFALAGGMWWIYSGALSRSELVPAIGAGQPLIYAHLPLMAGLAALNIGLLLEIVKAAHRSETQDVDWLVGGSLSLWLLSIIVIHHAVIGLRFSIRTAVNILGAVLLLAIPLAEQLTGVSVGLSAPLAILIVLVIYFTCNQPKAKPGQEDSPDSS
jgi:low temperature requirement protein LtrA